MFGAGFDCDSGGGERGGGGVEGLFEGPGIPEFRVGREESEEGGGGAGPVAGFGEEGIEELEQGRRRGGSGEGFLHFGLGVTEGGGGGERPGEGVGVAEVAGELDFGAATEGGTEGGAEGAEHGGVGGGELVEDFGFGPEAVRGRSARVMVRARRAKSGAGDHWEVTAKTAGRRTNWKRVSRAGSAGATSGARAPAPVARRQKASLNGGVRVETWSKVRSQWWRAIASSWRALWGSGERGAVAGSTR